MLVRCPPPLSRRPQELLIPVDGEAPAAPSPDPLRSVSPMSPVRRGGGHLAEIPIARLGAGAVTPVPRSWVLGGGLFDFWYLSLFQLSDHWTERFLLGDKSHTALRTAVDPHGPRVASQVPDLSPCPQENLEDAGRALDPSESRRTERRLMYAKQFGPRKNVSSRTL